MGEYLRTVVEGAIKIEQERVKLIRQHKNRFLSLVRCAAYALFPLSISIGIGLPSLWSLDRVPLPVNRILLEVPPYFS
jgi:hypothetical protein